MALTTVDQPAGGRVLRASRNAGPPVPVLLLHGARTSGTMFRRQLEALDRASVPALALDLPGHGAQLGGRFTLDGAVDAVRAGVRQLGGRALVVGVSLGGYVAIEHRFRHPEESAGLVAASCSTPPASRLRDLWMAAARWIEHWPDQGARLNDTLVGLTLTAEAAVDIGAGGYALEVMTDVLREVGNSDTLAALAGGSSPVWIVNGRFDHFRTRERSMLDAARAGGTPARLVVVPHARHTVSLDAPVAFTRVVLETVATLSAAEDGSTTR
jgi:pimeloyl-ACP methyl ester carboxylesterase